eukprot:gene733-994_t
MKTTQTDTVIGNARIVLADRVIEHGWIAFADGKIAEFGEGDAPERFEDARGDLIMPGLIELHTDHLEAHFVPRPKVFWDPVAAVVSYDGQLATSGITTVLDSLRVWREKGAEEADGHAGLLADAIASARDADLLRALDLAPDQPFVLNYLGYSWAEQGVNLPTRPPCAFVDAEHALDPVYARKLGVNLDDLLISQPDTGEQALEIVDTLVRSNAIDVLVVDSVAALVPRAEIEGEMGDSHV